MKWFCFSYLLGAILTAALIIVVSRSRGEPLQPDDTLMFASAVVLWPLTWIVLALGFLGMGMIYLSGGGI
jgi:hypothetical protein